MLETLPTSSKMALRGCVTFESTQDHGQYQLLFVTGQALAVAGA